MKATNTNTKDEVQNEHVEEISKVGTWISVGILGAVILGTYFLLYGLYMARL